MNTTLIRFSLPILLCTVFVGCSTPPKQTSTETKDFASAMQSPEEQLLAQAHNEPDPRRKSALFLESAQLFLEQGLVAQADYALGFVDSSTLTPQAVIDFQLAKIEVGLKTGDMQEVKNLLGEISLANALQTTLSRQEHIVRLAADAYSRIDLPLDAAILLADYEGVFGLNQSAQLNEEIWLLFQRSKTSDLLSYTYLGDNPNTIAWLDLARQVKLNQNSIDEQFSALSRWLTNNPNHPISGALPLELDLLSRLPETAPNRIILALPLSGPLANIGTAITDGFLAAHFQYKAPESTLTIETFDTASRDLKELYELYEQDFSDKTLIVGPITKDEIEQLSALGTLSVDTLALNNPLNAAHQQRLYLFGLDPEQEMEQIGARMIDQGIQRAALIAPNTQRTTRLSIQFVEDFEAKGGHVVSKAYFDAEQSLAQTVAQMLSTSKSKQRGRRLMQVTGLSLETQPERRNDLDAILMLASHEEAKQIKPLLAFNFAQDLPVYASSSVHIPGQVDTNNDLSGVQFPDIPWVFNQSNPLRTQIEQARPSLSDRYTRFYALGADAYLLAPRLSLLREIENSFAQGLTGQLNINPEGVIERKLQWAMYRNGKAVTIN